MLRDRGFSLTVLRPGPFPLLSKYGDELIGDFAAWVFGCWRLVRAMVSPQGLRRRVRQLAAEFAAE